jgi:hypothetical protein
MERLAPFGILAQDPGERSRVEAARSLNAASAP